jgi:hypothetical protein
MKYGSKTIRFGFNGIQFNMKKCIENISFTKNIKAYSSVIFHVIAVGLALFFLMEPVNAQFLVQPGSIQLDLKPRQVWEGVLKVHNFDPNEDIEVDFKVLELTQKENGDWLPFSTDPCNTFDYYPGLNLSNVSSCSSWVKLDKTKVTVPKDGDAVLNVTIKSPMQARTGFYGAAIMASTLVRSSTSEKVHVVMRSGVPIVAEMSMRTMASKIKITDLNMEFVPSEGPFPGRVFLNMQVQNDGITFPRLRPIIRVRGLMDKHWRLVTTHEFKESAIIPGVGITLKSEIDRSLPSGTYQLDGVLYVDGSISGQGRRFAKEFKFKGDPLLTKTATDVPLDLVPRELFISTSPGSTRFGNLEVHNAADETIQIQPVLDIPVPFKGKAKDNVIIEDAMTCIKWLSFEPQTLSLSNFQTRSLKVAVQMPDSAVQYPYYYAALGLKAVYPDGQVAGTSWVNICLQNPNAIATTDVKAASINLIEINASKSQYAVRARFVNNGNAHIIPSKVRAAVVKADGFGRTSALLNSDKIGILLPFEDRFYQGILDFSTVASEDYNLEVLMDYPPDKTVSKQIRIKVTESGNKRIPEILEQNLKSDELIQVQWQ